MQNKPSSPHDLFFVTMFSDPEIVRDFIVRYFPQELLTLLDLSDIRTRSESYADKTERMFTDVIIQLPLKQSDFVEIFILFEHKSYPDRFARLQILRYLVGKWREWELSGDTSEGPPIIIPVLVSHGERKWRHSPHFEDLFDCPSDILRQFIPKFTHLLYDLHEISIEQIREDILLNTALLAMKYIHSQELRHKLKDVYAPIVHVPDESRRTELARAITSYIVTGNNTVDIEDIEEAIHKVPQGDDIMQTIAETWLQEGIEKGIQQGMQQGMQLGREEGKEEALRATLSSLLIARFQLLPQSLAQKLKMIDTPETLTSLTINTLNTPSLEEFETLVDKALASRLQ